MPPRIDFKLDKGWKRMAKAVDKKKFQARVRQHVALETRRNGQRGAKAIRQSIKRGDFAANAALTKAIKGSSKPLVDNSDLFKAVTFKVGSWDEAFVGVLRTDDSFNIAEMLHEGGEIKVTAKMRGLFYVLWLVSQGADPSILSGRARELWERMPRDWKPLKASTTVIRIPKRPFITNIFNDPAFIKVVHEGWEKAVKRAFRDAAAG